MDKPFFPFFDREKKKKKKIEYKCSMVFDDDFLVEMIYDLENKETKFAIFEDGKITYKNNIEILDDPRICFSSVSTGYTMISVKIIIGIYSYG